jgi:hypothetical protein
LVAIFTEPGETPEPGLKALFANGKSQPGILNAVDWLFISSS